ncbi:hypothetical protein GCM10015536_50040 [Streptomyces griseomycini]|nr:hypothetical protein GCM10015536_50040 [Streptomyces griseomycini]
MTGVGAAPALSVHTADRCRRRPVKRVDHDARQCEHIARDALLLRLGTHQAQRWDVQPVTGRVCHVVDEVVQGAVPPCEGDDSAGAENDHAARPRCACVPSAAIA